MDPGYLLTLVHFKNSLVEFNVQPELSLQFLQERAIENLPVEVLYGRHGGRGGENWRRCSLIHSCFIKGHSAAFSFLYAVLTFQKSLFGPQHLDLCTGPKYTYNQNVSGFCTAYLIASSIVRSKYTVDLFACCCLMT